MRIECPQCQKLFEAESAQVDGEGVRFTCEHCRADIQIAASQADREEPVSAPPSEIGPSCPKCSKPVDVGVACRSCGLAAEYFESYEGEEAHRDQELVEAWQGLLASWDSDAAHEEFVTLLVARGDYRAGASHYRETAANPERAQRSQEMLQRIQTMAAAALLSSKPKVAREEEPFKGVVVLLMVLVVVAGAGGIYLMIKHKQSSEQTPPVYRPGPVKPSGIQHAPRMGPAGGAKGTPRPAPAPEPK